MELLLVMVLMMLMVSVVLLRPGGAGGFREAAAARRTEEQAQREEGGAGGRRRELGEVEEVRAPVPRARGRSRAGNCRPLPAEFPVSWQRSIGRTAADTGDRQVNSVLMFHWLEDPGDGLEPFLLLCLSQFHLIIPGRCLFRFTLDKNAAFKNLKLEGN